MEKWFNKNLKWIALILVVLFVFKSAQSCSRNMKLSISDKQYIHAIDSLNKRYNAYYELSQDSIKKLNFELELANDRAASSEDKARAVQNAVEKIRSNTTTTVVVKGAEEVKDTVKKK